MIRWPVKFFFQEPRVGARRNRIKPFSPAAAVPPTKAGAKNSIVALFLIATLSAGMPGKLPVTLYFNVNELLFLSSFHNSK